MTQYMRPCSDINTQWSCSTGSLRYACIDEETYSDTDYIAALMNGDYQECKLSTPANTPNTGTGILRFRAKKSSSGTGSITVSIRVGSTVIKTSSALAMTTSYAEYTVSLTESEMSDITDWTNVRVRFLSTTSSNTNYVSWAVLEVPNGALSIGLEMGCLF